jgi:glutathione S-transferase
MRARMALLVAGVAYHAHEIALRDKPAHMLAVSPKGTVPVLVLPTGEVLEQSWDIMRWALAAHDAQGWWSRAQTQGNLVLLECNDGVFKHHLDRYKYPDRFHVSDRFVHRAQAVDAMLAPLEVRLEQTPYLGGSTPCATDLALLPFVRQFAAVEPEWFVQQALPAVQQWLAEWLQSEWFTACMAKLPTGTMEPMRS